MTLKARGAGIARTTFFFADVTSAIPNADEDVCAPFLQTKHIGEFYEE
jgi:hypothetical protein